MLIDKISGVDYKFLATDVASNQQFFCYGLFCESTKSVLGVRVGAGHEIRTRDFNLGKVALYH